MADNTRASKLLNAALLVTQDATARNHIRQALQRLETRGDRPRKTQAQNWWDTIVAGTVRASEGKTAHQPTSGVAASRTLKQIDAMMSAENRKLAEIEANAQAAVPAPVTAGDAQLLQD